MEISVFLVALAIFAILACLLYPAEIRSALERSVSYVLGGDLDMDEDPKRQLNEEKFLLPGERISKQDVLAGPRKSLVMFATNSCPHCAGALSALREIGGDRMGQDIYVYEVGDKSTFEAADKYKIKHVPTFVWFDAEGKPEHMDGGGYEALKAFIAEKSDALKSGAVKSVAPKEDPEVGEVEKADESPLAESVIEEAPVDSDGEEGLPPAPE